LLERLIARWQGILLALIGIVATAWLAATDRLGLYIHPRYFWFTIIMAAIAAVFVIVAFAITPVREHEHDEQPGSSRLPASIRAALAGAIVVAAAVALLLLPPATLTSATASQRSINSSGATLEQSGPALVGGDTSQFTVKDWALLLRQNPDAEYFADQTVEISGFVTESPDDPENVFYVARFVVTCCAVDAQPVGVPVYLPGWAEQFEPDEWVAASGAFVPNPDGSSTLPLLMEPADLTVIEQPDQPYVF
jgi:uncharacterized repeat protein (TIGR03943 family)